MARTLSYADAVRLLGGKKSRLVDALDKITGGLLLASTGGLHELANWFDAKDEFVRLCHDLVNKLYDRRAGLSRYDRTERLEAAHTVLVVLAYFEALAEADLPFRFGDLGLAAKDQIALTGGSTLPPAGSTFMAAIQSAGSLLPEPQVAHDVLLDMLKHHYVGLSGAIGRLATSLTKWERLTEQDRRRFTRALDGVPARACRRYQELFRRLAVDFPEVGFWAGLHEHGATRAEVRHVGAALVDLERLLGEISTGRPPDDRRALLARAYAAVLDLPLVASGEVPGGDLRVPVLREGYVEPLFRIGSAAHEVRLSDESWWEALPVRADLREFLAGFLTSRQATRAPLVVLGQPGSGKSLFTQVLAARLPAADFLPVRVLLREVPAAAPLQDQIEHAIRSATGERLDWPELVRSGGDALPVVLLDGFDELLQATGVSQSDYLIRVADFQRREVDQGRPVAVIVTSRTSVADRAHVPEDTVAVRLEPFDDRRVTTWVETWNAVNATYFEARDLLPLPAATLLAHRSLAEQPLLLLMMALYDADGNALQEGENHLHEDELYERLLHSFARREVAKLRPGLAQRDLAGAVEEELRRLSVVAFAMFNRRSLWITESDLETDLPALLGEAPQVPVPPDMRARLRASEIVLGRFFFVHRAQALRDDTRLEAYEFLHATFGEFLVARFTWQVLSDIAARETASTLSLTAARVNDDLLHALLSFAPLSLRTPTIRFLTHMAARRSPAEHATLSKLLAGLFREVHQSRSGRAFANYLPRVQPVPARHAAYSANLVLLAVCVATNVAASALFGQHRDVVNAWKDEALLWRSQLGADGWDSLVETLALQRVWDEGGGRDIRLTFDDGTAAVPPVDPFWSYNRPPDDPRREGSFVNFGQHPATLLRKAHLMCQVDEDLASHTMEPLAATLGVAVNTVVGWGQESARTAVNALVDAWLLPLREVTPEERAAAYELCAEIASHRFPPWEDVTQARYAKLLLGRLATDDAVPAALAAKILTMFAVPELVSMQGVAPSVVRCVLAFLGIDADSDRALVRVLDMTEGFSEADWLAVIEETRRRLARLERFVASAEQRPLPAPTPR